MPLKLPPDLVAIAAMLNKTAQVLLDFDKKPFDNEQLSVWQILDQAGQSIQSARNKISKPYPKEDSKQVTFFCSPHETSLFHKIHYHIEDGYKRGEFNDEVLCFYVPAAVIKRKYELLDQYKLDNIFSLLHIFCVDLLNITKWLDRLNEDKSMSDKQLYCAFASLSSPLRFLSEIISLLGEFKLVYKKII